MRSANLRSKALLIASIFAGFVVLFSVYLSRDIDKAKENIVEYNTATVERAIDELVIALTPVINQVWTNELAGQAAIPRFVERSADSLLSQSLEVVLQQYDRIEGGIYFMELDDFIGYSYPSIPSPKPAYGPPPRSYNIIRDQVRESIHLEQRLVNLHGFDPAIFPLGTIPVFGDSVPIAAIWARTHIERELAASGDVTTALIYMTLVVSLLGFLIAISVSWNTKVRIDDMREGLDRIKNDNTYRLEEPRGVLGTISHYINDLVSALLDEQQRSRELERSLHQKEKMATLGNLIAGAAHEINTPVAIIKTRVQIWERALKKLGEDQNGPLNKESLQIVQHEIDRISTLVKRLLIFTKPVNTNFVETDLCEMLGNLSRLLAESLDAKIVFNCTDDTPRITADPYALEQVFLNVIKNSVEANGENTQIHIAVKYHETHDNVVIYLQDNGPGIKDETLDTIFDPFYTTKPDGTGLGLSISFEIVRAHHGNIRFKNHRDGGVVCEISLPVHQSEKQLPV